MICHKIQLFRTGDVQEDTAYLQLAKIKGDGNCLFRALAHQLFQEKLNTSKQNKSTKKLRADLVEYIKSNYADFEHELKGSVLDRKSTASIIEDIESDCRFYLNHCLQKSGCWGGAECIKAASRLYKVNVIIVNENGPCYLVNGFNSSYKRCVILAYRLASIKGDDNIRNHYDSVTGIDQNDIFKCMKSMVQIVLKAFFGENENVVDED